MAKRGQGEGSITEMKNGLIQARITLGRDENGKQKRKAKYFKTKKEAKEWLTEVKSERDRGLYIEPSKMTLTQWLDIWLTEYKKPSLRLGTYIHYVDKCRLHINPYIGKIKLKELRSDTIQRMLNSLLENGRSYNTVRETHKTLYSALEQALKNGLIAKNVAKDASSPAHTKKRSRALTLEEQNKFIDVAKGYVGGEVFLFMLATGMRIGEALALTWDDIDWKKEAVTVNKTVLYEKDPDFPEMQIYKSTGPPKTKSSNREVPLFPSVLELLKSIKAFQESEKMKDVTRLRNMRIYKKISPRVLSEKIGVTIATYGRYERGLRRLDITTTKIIANILGCDISELLEKPKGKYLDGERYKLIKEPIKFYRDSNIIFCTQTGELRLRSNVGEQFNLIASKANIKGVHSHCLRHTFATRGLEQGIPLKVMQELLGHSSIQMTADIYSHVLPETKRIEVMKLTETIKL